MNNKTIFKKLFFILLISFSAIIFNCSVHANQEEHNLKITSNTSLIDDLDLLKINYDNYKQEKSNDTEKILAIFKDDEEIFIYIFLSQELANDYALTSITINDVEYLPTLCNQIDLGNSNTINTLKKFKIKYYTNITDTAFQFTITRYKYLNMKNAEFLFHNTDEKHFFGYDESNYYYEAQHENTIEIQGKLFSYKIEINTTVKDMFTNMWYDLTNNSTEKERLIYYLTINFYDLINKRYFTPDSITSLSINFLEQDVKETWTDIVKYFAPDELNKNYVMTKSNDVVKNQVIKPKDVTIDYARPIEKFFSSFITNGQMYTKFQYQTIAKVDKDNLTPELFEFVKGYDYVISGIGNEQGYNYTTKFKTTILQTPSGNDYGTKFDYTRTYTQVSEVNVFKASYWYQGNHYTVDTNSLIGEPIEVDPSGPPTGAPEGEYPFWERFLYWLEKTFNFVFNNKKNIVIVGLVAVALFLISPLFMLVKLIWTIIKLPFVVTKSIFKLLFYKKRGKRT